MNEAPGPINFTMFLTMFGEKLNGTDPEDVIRNAFACFDEEGTGELQDVLKGGDLLTFRFSVNLSLKVLFEIYEVNLVYIFL